jgi:UDP-2,3-diacylglucosamine pyrophosphatase LpxH
LEKRKLEVAVISDAHPGTYGCRANELSRYLSTINPAILFVNGDIIDIWQFSKKILAARPYEGDKTNYQHAQPWCTGLLHHRQP